VWPCLGAAEVIWELLGSWGDSWRLLAFDLLEVADVCGAKRVDVLWDQRQHPSLSLLQPNLGEASFGFLSYSTVQYTVLYTMLWDQRHHPSLSLLQPNLGEASLCFLISA